METKLWKAEDFISQLKSKVVLNVSSVKTWTAGKHDCVDVSIPVRQSEIQKMETHFLALLKAPNGNAEFRSDGSKIQGGKFLKDSVTFIPAGRFVQWDVLQPMDVYNIFLNPQDVQSAADVQFDGKFKVTEGREFFGLRDPLTAALVNMIFEELKHEHTQMKIYLDSLLSSLSWRIVKLQRGYPGSVSEKKDKKILTDSQLKKAEEYLQASLTINPSLEDVSKAVGVSKFHFARGFTQAFGISPHQYLLSLKLKEVLRLIKTGKVSSTTTAFHLGFSSQSHLNKALKFNLGLASRELKKN